MEVLEVSGYVSEEKAVIAERYLAPQAKDASGLGAADVVLERDAVDVLIKYYGRESGVRNLKKHIDKVISIPIHRTISDLDGRRFIGRLLLKSCKSLVKRHSPSRKWRTRLQLHHHSRRRLLKNWRHRKR